MFGILGILGKNNIFEIFPTKKIIKEHRFHVHLCITPPVGIRMTRVNYSNSRYCTMCAIGPVNRSIGPYSALSTKNYGPHFLHRQGLGIDPSIPSEKFLQVASPTGFSRNFPCGQSAFSKYDLLLLHFLSGSTNAAV